MSRLDEIFAELAEIQAAMSAVAEDDFETRFQLKKRRRELHDEASAAASSLGGDQATEVLVEELERLRSRRRRMEKQRIDLVSQAGGGGREGAGASGLGGVELNQAIDKAQGLADIQKRIDRITGILSDRGVDTR